MAIESQIFILYGSQSLKLQIEKGQLFLQDSWFAMTVLLFVHSQGGQGHPWFPLAMPLQVSRNINARQI